jgi:hypothetical protein
MGTHPPAAALCPLGLSSPPNPLLPWPSLLPVPHPRVWTVCGWCSLCCQGPTSHPFPSAPFKAHPGHFLSCDVTKEFLGCCVCMCVCVSSRAFQVIIAVLFLPIGQVEGTGPPVRVSLLRFQRTFKMEEIPMHKN